MVLNADKGTNAGLDVNTDWLITANDKISFSFAFMNTEFGALILPPNTWSSVPTTLTGTDLPNAPHFSGALEYNHIFMLENGAVITPGFRIKISTGYWNTHQKYLAGSYTESFRMSNFYLTYMNSSGKDSVSLWGKNLENQAITQYAFPRYRKYINEPRTIGLTFSANF